MRILIVSLFAIGLAGCDQLLQGQQHPVKLLKNNLYATDCGGAVETWASCNDRAQTTCKGNYSVVRKNESTTGTSRELIFQCNK
jgi:hypothetical protein